ncbi:glycosyl hydrolase family 18 protein [Chitinophaga sp.]|uniref:glycosyl hydrolase family 18 protein n=1 Tax=Chitinophaga sp. TaxID=1869181 RepID=UPI0031DA8B15
MQSLYRRSLCLMAILLTLTLQAVSQFKVIGYFPTWEGSVNAIQYSKLTHINYAFLIPNADGSLQAPDDPQRLRNLVTAAHAAGVKVIISVGGGGGDVGFRTFSLTASGRTTFVNNMVSFCNSYNLDGVDLDWEYPNAGTQATAFVTLMSQLATAMHANGRVATAAVIGDYGDDSFLSTLFPVADWLNIMAYDDNPPDHSTYNLAVQCLNYWLGRGLPKEKAVLGVPFYGRRDWNGDYGFATLLSMGADPYADRYGDIGYNGITTIRNKTSLALSQAAGVMIWEIAQDATGSNSLLSAIKDVVNNGNTTTAPIGKTIWLKGNNGQYVSSKGNVNPMYCNATAVAGWNQFLVGDGGNGKVTLSNGGYFVSSENGEQAMNCNRTTAQDWEKFDWIQNADGTISLRGNNGLYVSSENGAAAMNCNRTTIQGWESFSWAPVAGARMAASQDSVVSIKTENGLVVYPNPVSKGSELTINVAGYDGKTPLQVFVKDIYQRTLSYKKAGSARVSISTGHLVPGMYVVVITYGNQTFTKQVLIL